MEKKDLLTIAELIRAKADKYKNALEAYRNEIKTTGRAITTVEEKMQDIQGKLLTQLNRHTQIYQLIYSVD